MSSTDSPPPTPDDQKPPEKPAIPPTREPTLPFLQKADGDGKFHLKRTQVPPSKPAKPGTPRPDTSATVPTPRPGSLIEPAATTPTPTPAPTPAPADEGLWLGREQTLVGAPPPKPATPAPAADGQGPWLGKESTLIGPPAGAKPKTEAWLGKESTLVGMPAPKTPAPMSDQGDAPWMGRESTLVGLPPGAQAGGSAPTDPKKLGKTTATMEDGWHLKGRKGPFTGHTWGDFELGGILGEGGMGAVYRAKQLSLRRRVAIKVLPPNLSADNRLLTRFQLEATTASKLQTPHVVQVYAIGEHDGNHFYAMEYVEGKDLYDIIKERREAKSPLTPDEAAGYILQAAKGLVEAGRQGITHRDIKPPNLLLTKDGLLKIADFGIVKVLGEHQLTMTGQAVGTPAYVSPEQGRGDSDVDPRSDLYSLGVVFYELACDKKPFDGSTANALIYQHCYEEPKLPREINPAISEEIQAVILRCLQKKQENRYQSAEELVRDLEAIRTGTMLKSAIASYKMGTGADEAKREQMTWLQRNMLPVAAAALLVIGAGVGGGLYLYDKAATDKAAKRELELVGEAKITGLRNTLKVTFDNAAPITDDALQQLDQLASLAGEHEQDADVVRWRAKAAEVRALAERLAPIEKSQPTVEGRAAARADLDTYIGKVGAEDVQAQRWSNRLKGFDAEEARLRVECAKLDTLALRKGDRDRYAPLLASLGSLVPKGDPQLAKWNQRIANFDKELAALRGRIEPLDADEQVTVAKRQKYLPVLADLRAYLDDTDKDLARWSEKLEGASARVLKLREDVTATIGAQPETISKPKQDQVAAKLATYEALAGSEDPQLKDWKEAIAAADRAISGGRERLARFLADAKDGLLPQGVLTAFERELAQLSALVYPGDADVLKWDQALRDSRRILDDLRTDCRVLEPSETAPVSVAAQQALAAKIDRLAGKGGLEPARADAYRRRLAEEAKRVEGLRNDLAAFDRAESITEAMRTGLDRLTIDAGAADADVVRWTAKRVRVLALEEKLGALDRREGVPEDVDKLFAELATLVGGNDPHLITWHDKVDRITDAKKGLRILDQRAPYSGPDVAARLAVLGELVGTGDLQWLHWKEKADEVAALKAELARLPRTIAQDPAANELVHVQLRRLASDLVGAEDPDVIAAAKRQDELDGPPRPAWAADTGRDQYGIWAEAKLPGGTQRFRYLASGAEVIGSPDGEKGRESDELPVRLILPHGFWLAEVELSRAVYGATAADPSRTRLVDAEHQPVERITWTQAVACCTALNAAVPGLGARLPLEAEWEYACRAGVAGPWDLPAGMAADESGVGKLAWHADNSGGGPRPSRGRQPNHLGLFDLHGNLAEWCADAYTPYPTAETVVTAAATGGDRRVLRGGSWGDDWIKTRAANRIPARPDLCSAYVGMRLALDADWSGRTPDGAQVLAKAQEGSGGKTVVFGVAGWRVKLEREGTK
jgi:formylglycine-generating enzyme required for sulfatase activity